MAARAEKWYYDLKSGTVSKGKKFGFETRMGPYDSEAQAREALEIAARRNDVADQWEEED